MANELSKPASLSDKLGKLGTPKPASLSERVAAAQKVKATQEANTAKQLAEREAAEATYVASLPNRIVALADDSGSMEGSKNESLRSALKSFLDAIDTSSTAVSIQTFNDSVRHQFTTIIPGIKKTVDRIQAPGGTPLAAAMNRVLETFALTRQIIISDGQSDNDTASRASAQTYREAGIPCDTLYIEHTASPGEEPPGITLMRDIAEITGGVFIHFTNLDAFVKALSYLVPENRHKLLGANIAGLLGAAEIHVSKRFKE